MKHLNPELCKKIEEEYGCPITQVSEEGIDHFLWLEDRKKESYILGYKEAIELTKEWLAVKGVFGGKTCGDLKQYITDFETDMNKCLEEKK